MAKFIIEEQALVSLFNCLESFALIHSGQVGNLINNVKSSLVAFNDSVDHLTSLRELENGTNAG